MRAWDRARYADYCGHCGRAIAMGEPRYVITPNRSRAFIRCVACAGEAVPEDLPALVEALPVPIAPIAPIPKPFTLDRRPLSSLASDWKTRASGRDPGEDD